MASSNSSNNDDDLLGRELLDPPTFLKTRDFPFLDETPPELINYVLNLPEMIRRLYEPIPKRKLIKKTRKHVKKRKREVNGVGISGGLTAEDSRRILHPFTRDQLLEIVQTAVLRHADVLDAVRSVADRDPAQRKLLIHGLGWETTAKKLRSLFAQYGEVEEASIVLDKAMGKSKGYGFVTFKHTDGALQALREPRKQIDGRVAVAQLVVNGDNHVDASNVPFDGRRGNQGMVGPVGGNGGHGYGIGAEKKGGSGQYGGYPGSMAVWQFGGPYGGGMNFGGPGSAGYGRMGGGAGRGSFFGLPPSSGGFPGGGYQQSGAYNLSSSEFWSQHNQQPTGTSTAPRVPPGGLCHGANPYY